MNTENNTKNTNNNWEMHFEIDWKKSIAYSLIIFFAINIVFYFFFPQTLVKHGITPLNVELQCNHKLISGSWNGLSLWTLTKKIENNEIFIPHEYLIKEKSAFNIFESTITLKETKCL